MTSWQLIRLEYMLARRQHGWIAALRIAIAASREPTPF